MEDIQLEILDKICYTELVYQRINKKLGTDLSKETIEEWILSIIMRKESFIIEKGKNYYVADNENQVEVVINKSNCRVITANKI